LQTSIKGRNKWDVELGYFEDSIGFERLINEIQPIPLTDEWLLKFGFFKRGKCWYLNDNSHPFTSNCSTDIDGFFIWIGGFKIYIKHVHRLQNLYFVLCGEELELICDDCVYELLTNGQNILVQKCDNCKANGKE